MKKLIAMILAVLTLISLAGCKKQEPQEMTSATETVAETTAETTVPSPAEPETMPGTIRAGLAEVQYREMTAGETVKILGTVGNYSIIEGEPVNLLVENRFLRREEEGSYQSWTGYAKSGAKAYSSVYMEDTEPVKLQKNTKLEILEGKDNWVYAQWKDGKGYLPADQISKWYISSGGSSSGGNQKNNQGQDGSDVPIGSLTSVKNTEEDVQLCLLGNYYGPEMEKAEKEEMAHVLAEQVRAYACLLNRGDSVKITESNEKTVTVYLGNEVYGTLPRWLVIPDGESTEYPGWTGYARWNGTIFEEYQLRTEHQKLGTNQKVKVLDELSGCYLVEYGEYVGYMPKDHLSQYPYQTGGSGGTGNSGGNGSTSGSTWTPPAL